MEVPNVKRKDYQLIGMDDDFLSLMDDSGDTRDDLKCPPEDNDVGKEVRDAIANEADILVSPAIVIGVNLVPACNTLRLQYTIPGHRPLCLWRGVRHRYKSQHRCRQIKWNCSSSSSQLKTGNMWPDFVTEL